MPAKRIQNALAHLWTGLCFQQLDQVGGGRRIFRKLKGCFHHCARVRADKRMERRVPLLWRQGTILCHGADLFGE
ncbi:hypothetical protein WA016_00348 [Myxococcus stipitatus]